MGEGPVGTGSATTARKTKAAIEPPAGGGEEEGCGRLCMTKQCTQQRLEWLSIACVCQATWWDSMGNLDVASESHTQTMLGLRNNSSRLCVLEYRSLGILLCLYIYMDYIYILFVGALRSSNI